MILPCWGETALVKKRLPSRKCVYFVLKEASLLGVGSFHWTSLLSIRILQDSWYVDIIHLLNLKKKVHTHSPQLSFSFGGVLTLIQTENHWRAAIFLVCQAWTQKLSGHFCHEPNLAQETKPEVGVFWCQNWCFFFDGSFLHARCCPPIFLGVFCLTRGL